MPVRKREEVQEVLRKMKNYRSHIIYRISLPVLSACLLILSFPGFNLWLLAWIGLVPMLFAIENKKPYHAFLISYLIGALFFLGTVYWLIHVTLPGMIIVVLYLALYFGIFGLICNYYLQTTNDKRRTTKYYLLPIIPAAWVALEFLRAHFITGFGWNLLGYSQSSILPVIQIADMTGVYGVSFLVVMVNSAIYLTIREVRKKNYHFIPLAIAAAVLFITCYYGIFRTRNIFTGEKLRVAVVQGNIPQVKKWDLSFREDILNKYERLTRQVACQYPELIIWPETSVPGFLESEPELLGRVTKLAKDIGAPLLVGAPREDPEKKNAYYNSTFLVNADGRVAGRYDKMHLVPFGEYVPLRALLGFVENFAPSPIGDFTSGKDHTVFNFFISRSAKGQGQAWRLTKRIKFSTLICFEDIFPGLAGEFARRDALFLVNMTNDAWFGRTSAAYQHVQNSVFRAVETRLNVIRAANTGVSCFINQKGEITGMVESGGQSMFVDGFCVGEIILTRARTFYTLYGDLFAYLCLLAAIASLAAVRLKISLPKKRMLR